MQPDKDALRENKREMFDGMRAYHQSEISHSNHAISILLAIAGAAGAAVLAMLFPENPPVHLTEIAWGLFVVVAVLSFTVALTSHLKISSDHERYKDYGTQYMTTGKVLGFFDEQVQINGQTLKINTRENIGKGKGYRKTQAIIWSFAAELIFLAFLFAMFSCYFVPEPQQSAPPRAPASAPLLKDGEG